MAKGDPQPDIQTLQLCEFHLGKKGKKQLKDNQGEAYCAVTLHSRPASVQILPDANRVYPKEIETGGRKKCI